ncbi:hypothetical protein [Nocardioides ochotonae]|uniref:hypothetical protein n=1 Tax=Nocardioides ochotonae TaxID=2685869 RepID=UPI00140C8276|nr:hypothetical protein [Nocardioides ochotonae]
MLRIATAGLCMAAVLGLSGCTDPAVAPTARIGAPDRGSASPEGPEAGSAPAPEEPEGLPLHSTFVRGTGSVALHGRAAGEALGQEFDRHADRLAREFRGVWVAAGGPHGATGGVTGAGTGDEAGGDFYVTVTGAPSPALLARVAQLPMGVEVLSGDLLSRRGYVALATDVLARLTQAGVADGVVVGVAPYGDALTVHAPVDPADIAPLAAALTQVAADLDARAADVPHRRAALRGAVPIRLYARSADGDAVPAGGVVAGPLPRE